MLASSRCAHRDHCWTIADDHQHVSVPCVASSVLYEDRHGSGSLEGFRWTGLGPAVIMSVAMYVRMSLLVCCSRGLGEITSRWAGGAPLTAQWR